MDVGISGHLGLSSSLLRKPDSFHRLAMADGVMREHVNNRKFINDDSVIFVQSVSMAKVL